MKRYTYIIAVVLLINFACPLKEELGIKQKMLDAAQEEEDQKTHRQAKSKCTFFAGTRYSVPESSLVNCYWYNRNACCKRIEVTSVFSSLLSQLKGANRKCHDMLRYLLCYFCSPEQHFWFRNNQVYVCQSFCDDIFANCRSASMGDRPFLKAFKSGSEFCEGNNFAVQADNMNCFAFDSSPFGGSQSLRPWRPLTLLTCLVLLAAGLSH